MDEITKKRHVGGSLGHWWFHRRVTNCFLDTPKKTPLLEFLANSLVPTAADHQSRAEQDKHTGHEVER